MTEYRIVDVTTHEGQVTVLLAVGKRSRLEYIQLEREKAWRMFGDLGAALRRTEGVGGRERHTH